MKRKIPIPGNLLKSMYWRPRVSMVVLAVLALSTTMCSGGSSSDESEPDLGIAATLAAMQIELANAQATAEAASALVPQAATSADQVAPTEETAAIAPGQNVEDRFDSDIGTFALGEGIQIQNGALLLGPFEQCAADVAAFDSPINCTAVCQTCGSSLMNYHMELDISFADGLADKGFGVVLRFVDENGDMMLDREDYYLVLSFNAFENEWSIFVHVPDEVAPWYWIKSGEAGLRGASSPNKLEITASNNGRMIDIFLNDFRMVKLTGDTPQPGETLVENWVDRGAVGFSTIGRRVQARYDNFLLEPLP